MKIYISVDMEGICGVVNFDQTRDKGKDYERARKLMTQEVNAALDGAFRAGCTEVLVNDSHGDMRNLIIEELDSRATLLSGVLKPLSMVAGIESGFDGAFFLGYHTRMGTQQGILCHTFSSSTVSEVSVNGRVLGETGLNALVAGHYGVPVLLVTGDEAVATEAQKLLGRVETVAVKKGVSRTAARCLHPQKAQALIKTSVIHALQHIKKFKPFRIPLPLRLRIRFMNPGMADAAETMPGAKRISSLEVQYRARDPLELYNALVTMALLASTLSNI
jgi:D-amino peptidase